MKNAMRVLGRVPRRNWAWVYFKISVSVWALNLYNFTPDQVERSLGWGLVTLICCMTISGMLVSISGMVTAFQGIKWRKFGTTVELGGLLLLLVGPFVYGATQLSLGFDLGTDQRVALVFMAHCICVAILVRICEVFPFKTPAARAARKLATFKVGAK